MQCHLNVPTEESLSLDDHIRSFILIKYNGTVKRLKPCNRQLKEHGSQGREGSWKDYSAAISRLEVSNVQALNISIGSLFYEMGSLTERDIIVPLEPSKIPPTASQGGREICCRLRWGLREPGDHNDHQNWVANTWNLSSQSWGPHLFHRREINASGLQGGNALCNCLLSEHIKSATTVPLRQWVVFKRWANEP